MTNLSDTAEEMAEKTALNYPHKNSAQFMYRDYMRVISRKYDEPQAKRLKAIVRQMFLEYAHLPKKEMFQTMGEGTRFLGLLACEEDMHDRGLRHMFLKTKWDIRDVFDCRLDCKLLDCMPYIFQLSLWTDYGLDEYGQTTAWLAFYNEVKDANKAYEREKAVGRDEARKWMLRRLDRYEQAKERRNKKWLLSLEEKKRTALEIKVEELFEKLDKDNDGFITYLDLYDYARFNGPGFMDCENFCYLCDLTGIEDYEKGLDFESFYSLYLHHESANLELHHTLISHPDIKETCEAIVAKVRESTKSSNEYRSKLLIEAAELPESVQEVLLALKENESARDAVQTLFNCWQLGEKDYNTCNQLPFGLATIYVQPRILMLHNMKYLHELPEEDIMEELDKEYTYEEVEPSHKKNWDPREAVLGMDVALLSVKDIRYLLEDLGLDYDPNVAEEHFDKEAAAREIENKVFADFEPEIDNEFRERFLLVRPFEEGRLTGPKASEKPPTFVQLDRVYKKQLQFQPE